MAVREHVSVLGRSITNESIHWENLCQCYVYLIELLFLFAESCRPPYVVYFLAARQLSLKPLDNTLVDSNALVLADSWRLAAISVGSSMADSNCR